MRCGDIFMGAFNAEQVMYNHFGYRSPIPNLYNAGSAGHPGGAISGGAGYISAGIIGERFGFETMVDAMERPRVAGIVATTGARRGMMIRRTGWPFAGTNGCVMAYLRPAKRGPRGNHMSADLNTSIFPGLKDRVVIITGAGQGIGRSSQKSFAMAGARAVIAEINESKAAAVSRKS